MVGDIIVECLFYDAGITSQTLFPRPRKAERSDVYLKSQWSSAQKTPPFFPYFRIVVFKYALVNPKPFFNELLALIG